MSFNELQESNARRPWPYVALNACVRIAWHCVRLPTLAMLLVLEPLVTGVLSALSLLMFLFAFFFRFLAKTPHFPFWQMLGFSVACALLVLLYYVVVHLFSYRRR